MIYSSNGTSPAEPSSFLSAAAGCLGQLRSPEGAAGALQAPAWQIESKIKVLLCPSCCFLCRHPCTLRQVGLFSCALPIPVKVGCVKGPFFAISGLQHPGERWCALLRFCSYSFKKSSGSPLVQDEQEGL